MSIKKLIFYILAIYLCAADMAFPRPRVNCGKSLSSLANLYGIVRPQKKDWGQVYQAAKSSGDLKEGALAIVNIALGYGSELGLSRIPLREGNLERADLKLFRAELMKQISSRNKNYWKAFSKELLWSFGPFFYRAVHSAWQFRGTQSRNGLLFHLVGHGFNSILKREQIEQDDFFMSALELAFPENSNQVLVSQMRSGIAKLLYPLLLAFVFNLISGISTGTFSSFDWPPYPGEAYLQDVYGRGGVHFSGQKVYAIALKHPYSLDQDSSEMPADNRNPLRDHSFDSIKAEAKMFDGGLVHSVGGLDSELEKAKSSKAGIVIFLLHGKPGAVFVGSRLLESKEVKTRGFASGTTFIFLSCDVGNIIDSELQTSEAYKLVRNLLTDEGGQVREGKGVVSVHSLLSDVNKTKADALFTLPFTKSGLRGIGMSQWMWLELMYQNLVRPYGWKTGFKTFEPKTGEIRTFINGSENSR